MDWSVNRVNQSEIYSNYRKQTNMVESLFESPRDMVLGQHDHVTPQDLHQYEKHATWPEDNRRTDNNGLVRIVVANAMEAPVSRNWKGYRQRMA